MQQFKKTRPNDWCDNNQCMLHKKTVKKKNTLYLVGTLTFQNLKHLNV